MNRLLASTPWAKSSLRFPGVRFWAAALVLVGAAGLAAMHREPTALAVQQPTGPQILMQHSFEPTSLPAGAATGTAARLRLPPGFNFKHVHGGPEFLYVISGTLTVTFPEGSTTYHPGDFIFVGGGIVHTASTTDGAELFVMNIRPVEAQWIIPVL